MTGILYDAFRLMVVAGLAYVMFHVVGWIIFFLMVAFFDRGDK